MKRRGFTMVEMLMVIGAVAVLAGILFPTFARAREKARGHSCMSTLSSIGLALRVYAADHDGRYPPTEDDLSPLYNRYIDNELGFLCPSTATYPVLMGAPADEQALAQSSALRRQRMEQQDRMLEQLRAGEVPSAPPGGALAEPKGLTTSYYYRAGHLHNRGPLEALAADHEAAHNGGANILFSDGGACWVAEHRWRELGFRSLAKLMQEREPQPPQGMSWEP